MQTISRIYNGSPQIVTAIADNIGEGTEQIEVLYNGGLTPPTAVGSYAIQAIAITGGFRVPIANSLATLIISPPPYVTPQTVNGNVFSGNFSVTAIVNQSSAALNYIVEAVNSGLSSTQSEWFFSILANGSLQFGVSLRGMGTIYLTTASGLLNSGTTYTVQVERISGVFSLLINGASISYSQSQTGYAFPSLTGNIGNTAIPTYICGMSGSYFNGNISSITFVNNGTTTLSLP